MAVAAASIGACRADSRPEDVTVVEVIAQTCARPQRQHGLGVVIEGGLIATAAHTVDGDLRELTVDGAPAVRVAIDARTDAALLAPAGGTGFAGEPARFFGDASGPALVHTLDGPRPVTIRRTGALIVNDATDRTRYEREVHTFRPGVDPGASGAPLTAPDGGLLGIVVLDRSDADEADAVTSAELARLLADVAGPRAPVGCDD